MLLKKHSKSGMKYYMGCLESRLTKNKSHVEVSELQFIGFYVLPVLTETTF